MRSIGRYMFRFGVLGVGVFFCGGWFVCFEENGGERLRGLSCYICCQSFVSRENGRREKYVLV